MSSDRGRQFITIALLLGAVAFGMVLAGSLDWTPTAWTQDGERLAATVSSSGRGGLPDFAELAEAVSPAVVFIETVMIDEGTARPRMPTNPWEFFFGPQAPPFDGQPQQPRRNEAGGSGFVIDSSGLIVTNNHVIDEASEIQVHLGERTYRAEVVGTDPATDLALLRIDAGRDLTYLRLGDSESLRPGDWVMAIGSPFRLENTVTVGVVSAKGRSLGLDRDVSFENFIQTDAAINFGNSGGPLVNLQGEVVGINTAINWGAENVGFAVPVDTLESILPQLKEKGRVDRGYLGISIDNLSYDSAEAFGLDEPKGALVLNVYEGTPAAAAGLQHGDIVLRVDDVPVEDTRDLIDYVSRQEPGTEVRLQILRNGERLTREVELAERSEETPVAVGQRREAPQDAAGEWLGLRYQDLSPALKRLHGLPAEVDGVWIAGVAPDSPLYEQGIRGDVEVGYVITEVNGDPISGIEEFRQALEQIPSGARVRLYVRRFLRGEELPPVFAFPRKP